MANIIFTSTYAPSGQGSTTVNVKVSYTETFSAATDKTTLKITDIAFQVINNTGTYNGIPLYGALKVAGTTLYTFNAGATGITNITGNGYTTITYFEEKSVSISHTSDPKTVSIALVGGYTAGGESYFCAVDSIYGTGFLFGVVGQSKTITLTTRHWTVSYNANGGTGAPSSQTKKYGASLTLRSTTPTKAQAVTGNYTVTYDANGGSCSTTSQKANITATYTFSKWNTKTDGSGTNYNAGGSYTTNAAATLYAQYSSTTTTAAVTLPTPTRSGYTFDGWYTAASGGTRRGGAGASYTPTGNTTLYAQWTAQTSTIAASGGTKFGSNVTLTITRQSSSYTHTVTTSCGGHTETLMTKGSSTSLTWTPAVATYAQYVTHAMSATATITCTTYSGDTVIGSARITRTLSFNAADVAPSLTMTRSDPSGYFATYGGYVQGKSTMRIVVNATTIGNATVSSTSITANGTTYSSSPAVTDVLRTSGTNTVTAKITDSRSQSYTLSENVPVMAYAAPAVSALSAVRCDSDGTDNNTGAYFKVSYTVTFSPLDNRNSKSLTIKYKKRSASSWTTAQTLTPSSYTQSGTTSAIAADVDSSYDVRLELTDDFTTTTKNGVAPSAATHINHGAGKNGGIGIGKVSEHDKAIEIASDWALYLGANLLTPANLALGVSIPSNSNLNNYSSVGTYYVQNATVAGTISNAPITNSGYKLIVFAINYLSYVFQMVFAYNGAIYRRVYNGSGWSGWYRLSETAV